MDRRDKKSNIQSPKIWSTLFLWILLFASIWAIWFLFFNKDVSRVEISYTEFISELERNNIEEVEISGRLIKGRLKQNSVKLTKEGTKSYRTFKVLIPFDDPDLVDKLIKKGVIITAKAKSQFWGLVIQVLPWLVFIFIWFLLIRQMQAGSGRAFTFGKSRAKIATEQNIKTRFSDVAGLEEAKEELKEVIEFLRAPSRFQRLGGKIPKGVLIVGPPGTGKTLLARAVAGEAGVPFLSISGSDFVELFVGVGAARVRDLFEQAKRLAPCIVLIDEIDAVGRQRGAGLGGGHDEREQTLNQLLVEMDGFDTKEGIIIMAATNRPDILDPALLRPGRFDRKIVIDRPTLKGRYEILKVHTKNKPLAKDVDLNVIARGTPGFSGADLANLVNEAALLAARKGKKHIDMEDFEEAKDKVLMGIEQRSLLLSEEEKRITAYHEAGHTLVAKKLPGMDPIHKVTIIPRGGALGITQALPIDDRHIYPKWYLLNQIAFALGGRVAEQIVYNQTSTGASNDLERATEIARRMVCEWGMSEKIGPITVGKVEREIFLGRELGVHRNYSEETAREIDMEVKRIVVEQEKRARKIIEENREILEKLVEELLEKETLTGEEVDRIING